MNNEQLVNPKRNLPFLIFFGVYTTGAIFLLLLGLVAGVVAALQLEHVILEEAGRTGGLFGLLLSAVARASSLSENGWQMALDYGLSALNLGFGVFLVWHRPSDWVARLLGLGMVGTAVAFNFQSHGVYAAIARGRLGLILTLHFIFHAVSGATYLHALLIFPNGRLVPRRSIWLLASTYLLMAEEIGFSLFRNLLLTFGAVPSLPPPLLIGTFNVLFGIRKPIENFDSIIHAETAFFMLFFGLAIPLVGVSSQLHRYRTATIEAERQQTKLLIWALAVASTSGLIILLLMVGSPKALEEGVTLEFLEWLEDWSTRVFPPLFALIPAALFIGVLRYGLFKIDIVINRSLVYGPLTAILAGVFSALSIIFQKLFLAVTGSRSDAAAIFSALIVAAAFAPIRSRLQRMVDRHFK